MVKKIAFIGTSSTGKTTRALETAAMLKKNGFLVEALLSSDREFKFYRWQIEQLKEAQYYVIFYHLTKELELSLRPGVDIVVQDRSIIDFYAYTETTYQRIDWLWNLVKQWASTYSLIIYLTPKVYQEDGVRPAKDFVTQVDKVLKGILQELKIGYITDPTDEELQDAIQQVVGTLGKHRLLTKRDLALLPHILNQSPESILVMGSYGRGNARPGSDLDLAIPGRTTAVNSALGEKVKLTLGIPTTVLELPSKVFGNLTASFPTLDRLLKEAL